MDYMTLMGSEDVQRAGQRMSEAAETIRQAAGSIEHALTQHQQFLEGWLIVLEEIMDAKKQSTNP